MSKYFSLKEHGTQETRVVTETKLREMQDAPTFNRVYSVIGPASEADMAAHRKAQADAGEPMDKEPEAPEARPTGQALPAANPGANVTSTSAATNNAGSSRTTRTTRTDGGSATTTTGNAGTAAGTESSSGS